MQFLTKSHQLFLTRQNMSNICMINKGMRSEEILIMRIGDQGYTLYIIKIYYEGTVWYERRKANTWNKFKSQETDLKTQGPFFFF